MNASSLKTLGLLAWLALPAAAQVADSAYATAGEVAGITVLHREVPGSETVAGAIYLLGGAAVADPALQGLEALYLRLARRGSNKYPGDAARTTISRLGASTSVGTDLDWSVYGFRALSDRFPDVWDVFADGLVNPELKSAVFEAERSNAKARAAARLDSPDARVRALALESAFEDHPYALSPEGTPETLGAITPEDLSEFRRTSLVRSRLVVVVVGGVPRDAVESAVAGTLGTLPVGDYEWEPPPLWEADEPTVNDKPANLPTNYMIGYFGGPSAMDEDYPAFQLAVGTLSSFVFALIRSEGLSYAASAPVFDQAAAGGGVYVSTKEPEKAVELINDAIQIMKDGTFRRSTLQDFARNSMMSYYIQNQTPLSQVEYLARSYLYRGRVQTPEAYVEELLSIDAASVRRAANEYFRDLQWGYLGDTQKVPESDMTWH